MKHRQLLSYKTKSLHDMKKILLTTLVLFASLTALLAQSNQQCKEATNAQQAVENYQWINAKMDTARAYADSIMEKYERRIAKMKADQQLREQNAKKPD